MNPYKSYTRLLQIAIAGITGILLASCGASQDVQTADGIYSDGQVAEESTDNRNYYSQYFSAKAKQYESVPLDEDVIFTDIESYYTSEKVDSDGNIVEDYPAESYGWGDTSEITINIHSSPYYGYGYGYGYGHNYGYGYPGPYWNTPHWWYGSGWGISYGYHSYGYHYPFYGANWYTGWNHYPYYGYAYPYYHSYNPYGAYYSNVSYNRGRRNANYHRQGGQGRSVNTPYSRESVRETNRSNNDSYSRSETGRRIEALRRARTESARTDNAVPRNDNYSRPPARGNNTPRIRTNPRGNKTPVIRTNPRGHNNRTVTPPSTSRRSGTINSSSSGRSGGAVRSSGGSSRRGGGSL